YFLPIRQLMASPNCWSVVMITMFGRELGAARKAAALVCMKLRRETTLSGPVIISFENMVAAACAVGRAILPAAGFQPASRLKGGCGQDWPPYNSTLKSRHPMWHNR